MVTHIVLFKFKDNISNDQKIKAKEMIESLKDHLDYIEELECGFNFANEDRAMDMALIVRLKNRDDLKRYAIDSYHQEVIKYIKEVTSYTKVVDYEKE